jgi:hypothetical protein
MSKGSNKCSIRERLAYIRVHIRNNIVPQSRIIFQALVKAYIPTILHLLNVKYLCQVVRPPLLPPMHFDTFIPCVVDDFGSIDIGALFDCHDGDFIMV